MTTTTWRLWLLIGRSTTSEKSQPSHVGRHMTRLPTPKTLTAFSSLASFPAEATEVQVLEQHVVPGSSEID